MNIHPILVHFPIALLTIYSIMELIRVKKVMEWEPWFYLKAGLVILGFTSSILTFISGDAIEQHFTKMASLAPAVEIHSRFALATVVIYGILALAYHAVWLKWKPVEKMAGTILSAPFAIPLALIGLALVTITGALGGGIAFGPDIDPLVTLIFGVFGLQ